MTDHTFTRRSTLARFADLVAAAAGGRALLTDDAAGGNLAVESGAVSCVLTPELTEGPYYSTARTSGVTSPKVSRDRSSLAHQGPERVHLQADPGAVVDIWHADAPGDYSGFGSAAGSARSCGASSGRTPPGWPCSRRFIPAGTRAAPCTSTSRCTWAARSSTPASCSSPRRSPTRSTGRRRTLHAGRSTATRTRSSSRAARRLLALKKSGGGYVGSISIGVHK